MHTKACAYKQAFTEYNFNIFLTKIRVIVDNFNKIKAKYRL